MPIVDIEIVGDVPDDDGGERAQALCDAIAQVFVAPPATTWVRVRKLPRESYAENGVPVAPSDLPVFVTVVKRQVPARAELGREMAALAQAIGRIVGRPADRVHIEYAAAAAGRMAFGGILIE